MRMAINIEDQVSLKDDIYTSLGELPEELHRRANDSRLRSLVENRLDSHILNLYGEAPRAVLARSIFTPNRELEYFFDVSESLQLNPLLLEYDGKLVAKNLEKYYLCRLFCMRHVGKKGGVLYGTHSVVNFNDNEGKYLSQVHTKNGESLLKFHHDLLSSVYPGISHNMFSITDWFNRTRSHGEHYYFDFLSMFIRNGVLFDNYIADDKEEQIFVRHRLLSSFKAVTSFYGVKPLIVPLLPLETESMTPWFSYSSRIAELVDKMVLQS